MAVTLQALRAPEHRETISRAFGGPPPVDGEPVGLTYMQIIANPKLADLGKQVYAQLRLQFAEDNDRPTEGPEQAEYRMRLEGWAQMLEIMLDEVLNELEALGPPKSPGLQEMI